MNNNVFGLHHISVMSSSAQMVYDFYTHILGLRFVKKSINQDAPDVYHLYFGNKLGEPGTILTFFIFNDSGSGMRGTSQITKIQLAIPRMSLPFWIERFIKYHVRHDKLKKSFGNSVLTFYDPDGLQLELVATDENDSIKPFVTEDVKIDHAIRGFFGVELSVLAKDATKGILEDYLDYEEVKSEEFITRFKSKNAKAAKYVDVFELVDWPLGRGGAGTVHHVAFGVPNDEKELALREKLSKNTNLSPTNLIDRYYFHSVYFREPNNILFELATMDGSFTVDEKEEELGMHLAIPPKFEPFRKSIEAALPPINMSGDSKEGMQTFDSVLFKHLFIQGESEYTFLLLHGTGADENDLVPFAKSLRSDFSILSIRGNIQEFGMNRFFRRFENGKFDLENLIEETNKLAIFIEEAVENYKIQKDKIVVLGYSNGANFAQNFLFKYPKMIKTAILLHPVWIEQTDKKLKFENLKVLITSGDRDEYIREAKEIEKIAENFKKAGAKVELFIGKGGHEITQEEISKVKEFTTAIAD